MGLLRFWRKAPQERPKIPVMAQAVITQDDVPAAAPPNPAIAEETKSLRRELAMGLVKLSRASEQLGRESEALKSDLARQVLNGL